MDSALFTRWMPAASSDASRPLSIAFTASLRIANMRTMIDDDPSLRSSRETRQALTVALVKPARGSAVPGEELVQCHAVTAFRRRRRNGIQHGLSAAIPAVVDLWLTLYSAPLNVQFRT